MADVKTSDRGRRYVDIEEVIESRLHESPQPAPAPPQTLYAEFDDWWKRQDYGDRESAEAAYVQGRADQSKLFSQVPSEAVTQEFSLSACTLARPQPWCNAHAQLMAECEREGLTDSAALPAGDDALAEAQRLYEQMPDGEWGTGELPYEVRQWIRAVYKLWPRLVAREGISEADAWNEAIEIVDGYGDSIGNPVENIKIVLAAARDKKGEKGND